MFGEGGTILEAKLQHVHKHGTLAWKRMVYIRWSYHKHVKDLAAPWHDARISSFLKLTCVCCGNIIAA